MTTTLLLRSAELFWSAELCLLEYRCVFCALTFNTHLECLAHVVQPCGLSPHQEVPPTDRFYDGDFVEVLASNGCLSDIEPIEFVHDDIELIEEDVDATPGQHDLTAGDGNEQTVEFRIPVDLAASSLPARTFSQTLLHEIESKSPNGDAFIECDICNEHFQFRCQILDHMRQKHHRPMPAENCPPPPASRTATAASTVSRTPHSGHRRHSRRTPCTATTAAPDDAAVAAAAVVAAHTKPKPYCCEICGKQMSEKGNLMVHKRIHTGERPFPCQFGACERRFLSSSERTIHMRTHSGEKPFKCDQCGRQFHNKNHLNSHLRTLHSDVRPFRCDACGRTFKIREVFKKHQLTHTGERPYSCDVCGNTFRQRSAFQVHMNIHTDHRPFKCGQCDRGFHSSAARRSHEKIFHRVP